MARTFEIVFDEKTGNCAVHFSGVPTHDEEHQLLDQLVAKLQENGLTVDITHVHTEPPKIPQLAEPEKTGGTRQTERRNDHG